MSTWTLEGQPAPSSKLPIGYGLVLGALTSVTIWAALVSALNHLVH